MINIELKEVHIGHAIKKRIEELGMTKSEFGRLIGVPQQHINRILERDTMETKKLVKVCQALDFNFFALFCQFPTNVNAYLAAVALGGNATYSVGDATLLAQMEAGKIKAEGLQENSALLREQIVILKDQVDGLKKQLDDKDEIIKLYKEK